MDPEVVKALAAIYGFPFAPQAPAAGWGTDEDAVRAQLRGMGAAQLRGGTGAAPGPMGALMGAPSAPGAMDPDADIEAQLTSPLARKKAIRLPVQNVPSDMGRPHQHGINYYSGPQREFLGTPRSRLDQMAHMILNLAKVQGDR